MTSPDPHIPVMLPEVLSYLIKPESDPTQQTFIDGTFGNGGYTRAILETGANVIAIDRDPTAIENGRELFRKSTGKLNLVEGRFSVLDKHSENLGHDKVDGVVLDIGVSSMQLDQAERGFSFRTDGPLDMRMECSGLSAADVVNSFSKNDLKRIISVLGEEKKAGYVAHAIVEARQEKAIETTGHLAEIAEFAVGRRAGDKIHPATRTFQALRIYINRELEELADALLASERILKPSGRLVVVIFHSLEDRIVKKFIKDRAKTQGGGSRYMPEVEVAPPTFLELTKRAVSAGDDEVQVNPRSRSAKLRAAERLNTAPRSSMADVFNLPKLPSDKSGA